jgi:YidC/Oxa1 family membrane protein insertase
MKKELTMETRLLIAFVLMGLVLFLTPYFYKSPPPQPAANKAVTKQPAQTSSSEKPPEHPQVKPPAQAATPIPGAVRGEQEETYEIDTEMYHVVFSNRGGTIRSWGLKKYHNCEAPANERHKPIDLVNTKALAKVPAPLAIDIKGEKPADDPNQALFAGKLADDKMGIDFTYSDGKLAVHKSVRFHPRSYLTEVTSEVSQNGVRVPHLLQWRGGFGDASVVNAAAVGHTLYFNSGENSLKTKDVKEAKNGPVTVSGAFSFAGLEDHYFAAVFLPKNGAQVELTTHSDSVPGALTNAEEPHVGAGVGGDGLNRFDLYVGPKDADLLKLVNPKLEQLVDWGTWFGFLARPLFAVLNWTHDRVHNYGWSIVLVTIAINMLLLPLKYTSLKSARKMQLLQPEIQKINEKYKNIGLRDPRKAEQNQEIMDLYKRHGANPLGGCVPMLLQIPFFIAFYTVLTVAIELRCANWLWVRDLSQPETLGLRVLPIAMIITQFVLQKMTPTSGMDPTQQKIMLIMPLGLGFMFYGQSAGLVLYWLTGNLVGIAQQWFTNRIMPQPPPPAAAKPAPKKKGPKS